MAVNRLIAPMLVVLPVCFGLATAAEAQGLGYVQTIGGAISSVSTYNSAGGTNSVGVVSGTEYMVTMPGLGNAIDSNVQVNAVNTNGTPHYCSIEEWGTVNGTDIRIYLYCFTQSGTPTLADFSVLYQARSTAPADGSIAFLLADQPSNPSYTPNATFSYNSRGGVNKVTRSATGTYMVLLPRMKRPGGNVQISAYTSSSGGRCETTGWSQTTSGTNVGVYCVDVAGNAADTEYSLAYTVGITEGGAAATSLGAYAWPNNPTKKNYALKPPFALNTVSSAKLTAQRFGGEVQGEYSLTVPNPADINFSTILGMATPVGAIGEYCDTEDVEGNSGSFYLPVVCYAPGGQHLDAEYAGTILTTH